jgi:hypothetical protein
MKPVIVRVRILQASPTSYYGVVMHGDKAVESTGRILNREVCENVAETLAAIYRISLRAS